MVGICLVLITTRDEITEFLWEPLPDQGQLFAKLIEAKFFSKVDLSKGNYQLPVKKKEVRPYLTFSTYEGHTNCNVLPFVLSNDLVCSPEILECCYTLLTIP